MLKIGLIISNEWEIYGNGKEDFYSIQYEPTNKLLDVCERYGAKVTLMAEVGQQWAHEKLGKHNVWAKDIAISWNSQARDVIKRGHDVQLHLHPQWIHATHDGENWVLDYDHYSLTSFTTNESIGMIITAKKYLEKLLITIDSNYECVAFRAGNIMVDPSEKYVHCIIESGIKVDTTVCRGQYLKNNLGSYDFRNTASEYEPWWVSPRSLNRAGDNQRNLIEFPILSEPYFDSPAARRILSKLGRRRGQFELVQGSPVYRIARGRFKLGAASHARHRAMLAKRRARYPGGGLPVRRNLVQRIARLPDYVWRRASLMLDYDTLMPEIAAAMVVNTYEKLITRKFDGYIPIVAIGHVKNMINTEYIDAFLALVSSEIGDALVFHTLAEACTNWTDSQARHDGVRH